MPRYGFPIVPAGIQAAIGALDGAVASSDANAGRTRWMGGPAAGSTGGASGSSPGAPRSLFVQGGSVAAGLVGWAMGWPSDFVDPFIGMGLGLFAREAAFHLSQNGSKTPVAAQGYRAVAAAPARALAAPQRDGYNPPLQPSGIQGYEMQSAGVQG